MTPAKTKTPAKGRTRAAKPRDLLLALVLDKSGSMSDLASATIEGVNSLLAEQRKPVKGSTARLSMTLFDTTFATPYVAADMTEVPDLDGHAYAPGGMTALYDAVGLTIDGVDGWLANHPAWRGTVVVAIWTDGEENSSRHWSLDALNARVAERKAAGWEFLFLGTGSAAWTEGTRVSASIGTDSVFAVMDSAGAVSRSYAGVSNTISSARTTGSYDRVLAAKNLAGAVSDEENPHGQ